MADENTEDTNAGFGLDFESIDEMADEYKRLGLKPGAQSPHLRPGHAAPDQARQMEEDMLSIAAEQARLIN